MSLDLLFFSSSSSSSSSYLFAFFKQHLYASDEICHNTTSNKFIMKLFILAIVNVILIISYTVLKRGSIYFQANLSFTSKIYICLKQKIQRCSDSLKIKVIVFLVK
jgi:hypothetical protein